MVSPCCSCSNWSDRGKGFAMAVTAVLILSPDTLLIMLPDLEPWDLVFYRNLFFFIPITIFIIYRSGFRGLFRESKLLGWLGLFAAILYSLGSACFLLATITVGSANTLVCVAAAPMFAAIVSIFVLKEYPRRITWVAIVVALCAIALVVGPGLSTDKWYGNLYALFASFSQALYINIARLASKTKDADILPSLMLTGPMGMMLALCAGAKPSQVDTSSIDFVYVILQGLIIAPLSFSLLTIAARYISAPETSLTFLLETVLGPLWVFLVLEEAPTVNTIVGGVMLILNLTVHNSWAMYLDKKAAAAEGDVTGSIEDNNNNQNTYSVDQGAETDTVSATCSEEIKPKPAEPDENANSIRIKSEPSCEMIAIA